MLHAACAEMSARGEAVGYVPLDKRTWFVPEVLEGMENLALVCIDNIECIAGEAEWEMAIFDLYNRILETGKTRLLITGDRPRVSSIWACRIWRHVSTGDKFTAYSRCPTRTNCRRCSCVPACAALSCRKTLGVSC